MPEGKSESEEVRGSEWLAPEPCIEPCGSTDNQFTTARQRGHVWKLRDYARRVDAPASRSLDEMHTLVDSFRYRSRLHDALVLVRPFGMHVILAR